MAKNSKDKQREYDKKRAGQRSRNWNVILYPEDLPNDYLSKIEETGINTVISPLHDKDINADGSPKKVHRHCILTFGSVQSAEQVSQFFADLFGVVENDGKKSVIGVASPQKCANKVGSARYLVHMDNPEKAQYVIEDIICMNGANVREMIKASPDEQFVYMATVESIIEEQGFTEYAVACKYFRECDFDLYKCLITHTIHFNAFIRSRRHSFVGNEIADEYNEQEETTNNYDDNYIGDEAHRGDCHNCDNYLIKEGYCKHCKYNDSNWL